MKRELSEISDTIQLLEFGNIIHPITFILSFVLGGLFTLPLIDLYGGVIGFLFFIGVMFAGYTYQTYLYRKIKRNLINSVELIRYATKEISKKINHLSKMIQIDIAFDGVNIDDIESIRTSFISISESIKKFQKSLKNYSFLDKLILLTDESENTKELKLLSQETEDYLKLFLENQLSSIEELLELWLSNHKKELMKVHTSLGNKKSVNISGKGALIIASKRLESYISDVDRVRLSI